MFQVRKFQAAGLIGLSPLDYVGVDRGHWSSMMKNNVAR